MRGPREKKTGLKKTNKKQKERRIKERNGKSTTMNKCKKTNKKENNVGLTKCTGRRSIDKETGIDGIGCKAVEAVEDGNAESDGQLQEAFGNTLRFSTCR